MNAWLLLILGRRTTDKILSEEKLAVFKKAKLGKKEKVFPETRMKIFSIVKMFFK